MTELQTRTDRPVYSEPVGLTQARAERLLNLNGPNKLAQEKQRSAVRIFAGQFHDLMVLILIIATGISVAIGEYTDAIPILLIVVMNAVLGFVQEYRAEKTLEKLEQLTAPSARVYRDGRLTVLPAALMNSTVYSYWPGAFPSTSSTAFWAARLAAVSVPAPTSTPFSRNR